MSTKRKLKIGISCYPTYGGSGVIATEIGKAMANRGHKVHFITYDIPRRLDHFTENIFFHEVVVRDYPLFSFPPYSISLASKIVEVSQFESLDILHVHYAVPHATSAYLAKQVLNTGATPTKMKVITTLHGTDITLVGNDRSYLPITRFSIEQSDGITTPSKYLKLATYDKLNVSSSTPIEIIPNFVDTDKFCPAEENCKFDFTKIIHRCPKEQKTLIHVSNFRPVKRINDVIKVFAKVRETIPCQLVFIGDGPERSAAESLVRELNLQDYVCFLGKLENFTEILSKASLFILPSESESFGLAGLEAMSCGVPVIGSDTQGIPEVVISGQTGFLSNVGDVDAMAANAVKLLSSDSMHKEFSKNARKRVLDNFGLNSVVSKYEDYYYKLLGE